MRVQSILSTILAGALLAGCAATNAAPFSAPAGPERLAAVRAHSGRAILTIRIPRRDRKAHYVSVNTKSLTIDANKVTIGTFNLTPGSKGCTEAIGSTQCSLAVGVPTGRVVFVVKTYGGPLGKGNVLSSGAIVQTVQAGSVATIALTLTGVIASVKVGLELPNPPAGVASSTSAIVTAYDASGAAIVGPGNYDVPVTLTDGDGSGATTLTGTTTIAGPGASAVLNYNGSPLVSASISASANGILSGKIQPALFAPVPGVVASFALPAAIAGDEPYAIAVGPDGNLWFTTDAETPGAIVKTTTGGAMTAYAAGGTLTADRYLGIAAGPDGALWFTERNSKQIGRIDTGGNVTEYAATGAAGTACPNRIAEGPAADGAMWFTSECGGVIGRVTTAGVVQTFALGEGANFQDILLGRDGNLYVVDRSKRAVGQIVVSGGAVSMYSEVDIGPSPTDGGSDDAMLGLAQTGDGTLWWTNVGCTPSTIGSLPIASPFTASSPLQNVTLQSCGEPAFLAVAPAGGQTLWTAEYNMPTIEELTAPAGDGGVPLMTDVSVPTAPGATNQLWDVVRGPDGNLWATNRSVGGTILKFAY